jgi:hypothetical protein
MVKITVVSDSHGDLNSLKRIIAAESDMDYIVHCGDGAADLLRCEINKKIKVIRVSGNVDRHSSPGLDEVYEFSAGGKDFLAVHGDRFNVKQSYSELREFGKSKGVSAVLFGHTHIKVLVKGDPHLFNPGPADRGCYGIIIVNGDIEFHHKKL